MLRSHAKEVVNKLALPNHVSLVQPSNLSFPDHMHCLVAFDRPPGPSGDRKPRLAVMRFLLKRWSCSMMFFNMVMGGTDSGDRDRADPLTHQWRGDRRDAHRRSQPAAGPRRFPIMPNAGTARLR
jgi:hypothetical protein